MRTYNILWNSLKHKGPWIAPEYEYKKIPLIVNGEKIFLNKKAEEYAFLYSKFSSGKYSENKIFKNNFFNDWKKYFNSHEKIKNLDECDFKFFVKYTNDAKKDPELIKLKEKLKKEALEHKYAIVDGRNEEISGYISEPASLYLSKSNKKYLGKIKRSLKREDYIINVEKGYNVGEGWGKVISDNTLPWLSSWKNPVTQKTKYSQLSMFSKIRSQKDTDKYDKARGLKITINKLIAENNKNLKSNDLFLKQVSSVVYFIINHSVRVGNNIPGNEDICGIGSIKKKNIKLKDKKIILKFFGKDAVQFYKEIEVSPAVYKNLKLFVKGKSPDDKVFDKVSSKKINAYLGTISKGLTTKTFRTFNASYQLAEFLKNLNTSGYNKKQIISKIKNKLLEIAEHMNHKKNRTGSSILLEKLKKRGDDVASGDASHRQDVSSHRQDVKSSEDVKSLSEDEIKRKLLESEITPETCKANYIDPRILFSFLNKNEIPVNKIYSKGLIKRFSWANKKDFIY